MRFLSNTISCFAKIPMSKTVGFLIVVVSCLVVSDVRGQLIRINGNGFGGVDIQVPFVRVNTSPGGMTHVRAPFVNLNTPSAYSYPQTYYPQPSYSQVQPYYGQPQPYFNPQPIYNSQPVYSQPYAAQPQSAVPVIANPQGNFSQGYVVPPSNQTMPQGQSVPVQPTVTNPTNSSPQPTPAASPQQNGDSKLKSVLDRKN